jgi:hypothetical protein
VKHAVIALGIAMGGACAEPVVEIELTGLNPGMLDTSCATAVNMYVYGDTYETNKNDLIFDCKTIPGKKSAAEVKAAITGLFDTQIPKSGLLGVELEAHTGGCPTTASQDGADLVFNASARYDGSGRINLPVVPIASCEQTTLKAHAIDVLKLIASPTHDCGAAIIPDGQVFFGQLAPSLIDGAFYWTSGNAQISWTAGVGTSNGMPSVGQDACLAAYIGNAVTYSMSCATIGSTVPRVCAPSSEVEVGVIPASAVVDSLDQTKISRWKSVVVGSVWTGTTIAPATGVTVEADPDHSEVVYVEPGANNTLTTTAGATATGASGMFVLFADRLLDVKVKSGSTERTVKLGADKREPAVALIKL